MCTPGTVARILIDGRTLHIKRLVDKFKQRITYRTRTITKKAYPINVPHPYLYKKGVPFQRTVPHVPYCTVLPSLWKMQEKERLFIDKTQAVIGWKKSNERAPLLYNL